MIDDSEDEEPQFISKRPIRLLHTSPKQRSERREQWSNKQQHQAPPSSLNSEQQTFSKDLFSPGSSSSEVVNLLAHPQKPMPISISQSKINHQSSPVARSGDRDPAKQVNGSSRTGIVRQSILTKGATKKQVIHHSSNLRPIVPDHFPGPAQSRKCTNCCENNITCDGLTPCAYCEEPGFDCEYSEVPVVRIKDATTSKVMGDQSSKTVSQVPGGEKQQKSLWPTKCQQSCIHDNGWIPKNAQQMSDLIKTHQRNLNMQREYLLQGKLMQAKANARSRPSIPIVVTADAPHDNPWLAFLATAKQDLAHKTPVTITKIKVRSQTSKKKQFATTLIEIKPLPFDVQSAIMPKYKSIGRLGSSFLAKNAHTLKYMPYFPDDEIATDGDKAENRRNAELWERYKNKAAADYDDQEASTTRKGKSKDPDKDEYLSELRKQRKCAERVWHWSKTFVSILKELNIDRSILATWIKVSPPTRCSTCRLSHRDFDIGECANRIEPAIFERCKLLDETFTKLTSIPTWHFLHHTNGIPAEKKSSLTSRNTVLRTCLICFTHNCLVHGAYSSTGPGDDDHDVYINDAEDENNHRVRIVRSSNSKHLCGLFCTLRGLVDQEVSLTQLQELVSVDAAGRLVGSRNIDLEPVLSLREFHETRPCAETCFLSMTARLRWYQETLPDAKRADDKLFRLARSLIKTYKAYLRVPCMLARLSKVSCVQAFYVVLQVHLDPPHVPATIGHTAQANISRSHVRNGGMYNTDSSSLLDERHIILPCEHQGPCSSTTKCTCATEKIHCERFCGCDISCQRRFNGCSCAINNSKGVCFMDDRCDCYRNNRECDPWVCQCGVLEVLDPSNKYNEGIRQGRCQNCKLQLDVPAKTIQSPSEVQGWGLYAGEDLARYAFIGEYKGEIVSAGDWSESHRRGVVYHNGGLEYLFTINQGQEIDGSSFGNKMRFMNNSQLDKYINVASQKFIANGVQRVMFYAKKPITAGEELLYNYNYPAEITASFWEPGEQPINQDVDGPGTFVKPVKPRFSRNVARQAGAISATQQSRSMTKAGFNSKSKRKRMSINPNPDEQATDNDDSDTSEVNLDAAVTVQLYNELGWSHTREALAPNQSSEDEEYEDVDAMETDLESDNDLDIEAEDDDDDDEEEEEEELSNLRRRRIHEGDKRFGGDAQRKAAQTRRQQKESRLRDMR